MAFHATRTHPVNVLFAKTHHNLADEYPNRQMAAWKLF